MSDIRKEAKGFTLFLANGDDPERQSVNDHVSEVLADVDSHVQDWVARNAIDIKRNVLLIVSLEIRECDGSPCKGGGL